MAFLEALGLTSAAPLFAAGANIIGGLHSAKQKRRAASRQMSFQRDMSNTAYQRAMADMRQAGINPIMVSKLGGASTPTGAMAAVPEFGQIGTQTMQAMATAKQVELLDSQAKNVQAQTNKVDEEVIRLKGQNRYEFGDYEGMIKQKELKRLTHEVDLSEQRVIEKKLQNVFQQWENQWFRDYGAPKATLTAKVENYILSKAFTKLSKKQEDRFIKQIHDGLRFLQDNIDIALKNPELLYAAFGAMAGGFLVDNVLKVLKGVKGLRQGGPPWSKPRR